MTGHRGPAPAVRCELEPCGHAAPAAAYPQMMVQRARPLLHVCCMNIWHPLEHLAPAVPPPSPLATAASSKRGKEAISGKQLVKALLRVATSCGAAKCQTAGWDGGRGRPRP